MNRISSHSCCTKHYYHFVCSFVPVIACLCTVHFDYLPVVWPDPTTNPSWHTRMSCDAASNYLYCRNCLLVSYGYFSLFVFCVFFNILRFGFRVTVSALWALLVLYTFVISLAFTNSWSIVIVCRVQWLWADQSCGLTPDPSTDHYCAWGQASEVLWQQHRYVASAVCLSVTSQSYGLTPTLPQISFVAEKFFKQEMRSQQDWTFPERCQIP